MKSGEKRKKEFSFLRKTNIRILSLQQPAESQAVLFFLFFFFLCSKIGKKIPSQPPQNTKHQQKKKNKQKIPMTLAWNFKRTIYLENCIEIQKQF